MVDLNVNGDNGQTATPRLSELGFQVGFRPGPLTGSSILLLVGRDPDGTVWYAKADEGYQECPFFINADGVYDEGDVVHFSTGLVLPKSANFDVPFDTYPRTEIFPLRTSDRLCIDRSGTAVGVELSWGSEWTGLNYFTPFVYGGLLLLVLAIIAVVALVVRRLRR